MKRRQHTRANRNGQGALLDEIRGMRSELRKMCGFLRAWETNGMPTERVDFPVDTSELFTAPVDRGPAWDRVVVNPISSDTSVVIDCAREPLLPPDAAAAVEETFGELDPDRPAPFEPSQRWGRSVDADRLSAVRSRVLSAMAGCRTVEELEQLTHRIGGRNLCSLEQEFGVPSPGAAESLPEAGLPTPADSEAISK